MRGPSAVAAGIKRIFAAGGGVRCCTGTVLSCRGGVGGWDCGNVGCMRRGVAGAWALRGGVCCGARCTVDGVALGCGTLVAAGGVVLVTWRSCCGVGDVVIG